MIRGVGSAVAALALAGCGASEVDRVRAEVEAATRAGSQAGICRGHRKLAGAATRAGDAATYKRAMEDASIYCAGAEVERRLDGGVEPL